MHSSLLVQSFSLFFQPQSVCRLLDTIVGKLQIEAAPLQFIFGQKFRQVRNLRTLVTITTTGYHIGNGARNMMMMVMMMVLVVRMGGVNKSVMVMCILMLVG